MVQKQSTNKRGGARNFKKTNLSNVALLRLFENHLSEKGHLVAFQFGSYYNKPASNAVVGPELASMMDLIGKIVAVAPSADLKYIPMKDAFGKLLLKSKDLMGVFPNKDINAISSDLANSLMTVCNHARRLKEDIRWQQAIAKCNSHEIAQLKKIRGFFKNSQTDGDDDALPATQDILDQADSQISEAESLHLPASQDYDVEVEQSDVDSLLQEALNTKPVPTKKDDIAQAVALKRPAASISKRPAASIIKSKSASSADFVKHGNCGSFGMLHMTYASNQSYIQHFDEGCGKKKLLVAVSAKQTDDHKSVVDKLAKAILSSKATLSKDDVLEMRSKMLK
jgi:hypothetical protein